MECGGQFVGFADIGEDTCGIFEEDLGCPYQCVMQAYICRVWQIALEPSMVTTEPQVHASHV